MKCSSESNSQDWDLHAINNSITLLVLASVHNRLDYCNRVLYSLPWSRLQLLQSVLNSAARLIRGLKRFDHISPVLIELHWLPYPQRVKYKVSMLMFKCLKGLAPAYCFLHQGFGVRQSLVGWLWDPLFVEILLCLATGRIGVWQPLLLLVPAVGMSCLSNWGIWRLVQRPLRNTCRRTYSELFFSDKARTFEFV